MIRRLSYTVALVWAVGPQFARASTKVAVVTVGAVSEKYAKTADLEAQFDAVRRKLNQERDSMKEKIEKANRSLQEELKPGTDEFRARRKQVVVMEAELQWFVESEGQKVEKGLAELSPALQLDQEKTDGVWKSYLDGHTSWARPWSLYVLNEWAKKHLG